MMRPVQPPVIRGSEEEQTRRLRERITDGRKTWKLTSMDLKSCRHWYDYSRARDAMFAAEKASTILQLVTGEATQRTEHRELTESLDDHERELLSAAIDEWLATTDAVPG